MIGRMAEPSYLPLLEQLASFEPAVFVFGGIAEDALLDRSITRPHGDVDVLVARDLLARHLENCRSIGFDGFEVLFESIPGVPLVMGANHNGWSLELGVFDEIEPGIPSFVLPVGDGLVRASLPDDSLRHPVASIDGVPIRTVSPLGLFHLRQALMVTGALGPARDKDRTAQARLREELLPEASDADLAPRLSPFPQPT
jgi:hypothetical protein